MCDDGFDFVAVHDLKETRRNGHERRGTRGARRERVGFALVDADFGHRDARLLGLVTHDVDEVAFEVVRGTIRIDHLKAHAHLGHRFAHCERNERAREADDHREDEERAEVEVRAGHGAEIDAEDHLHHREQDGEHDENGEIGENQ